MDNKKTHRFHHVCLRCGYEWVGKLNPSTCANPRCNTPYWDKNYVLDANRKKNKYKFSKKEKNKKTLKKLLKNKNRIHHVCLRCGYEWVGKDKPKSCANKKCRSEVWNKPKPNKHP